MLHVHISDVLYTRKDLDIEFVQGVISVVVQNYCNCPLQCCQIITYNHKSQVTIVVRPHARICMHPRSMIKSRQGEGTAKTREQ